MSSTSHTKGFGWTQMHIVHQKVHSKYHNVPTKVACRRLIFAQAKPGERPTSRRGPTAPPPPPPPPPPLGFSPERISDGMSRRQTLIAGLLTLGVAAGLVSGVGGGRPSVQYEKELSYVASQIGVPGMPSPVSAILDRATGRIVAVNVVGASGQEYIGTVDGNNPNVMVLKTIGKRGNVRPGTLYRLPTRFESIDLRNRRQVESIFRIPNWEQLLR